MAVWNHPIDLHLFSQSVQGWPRLLFEVYHLDSYGGKDLCRYHRWPSVALCLNSLFLFTQD